MGYTVGHLDTMYFRYRYHEEGDYAHYFGVVGRGGYFTYRVKVVHRVGNVVRVRGSIYHKLTLLRFYFVLFAGYNFGQCFRILPRPFNGRFHLIGFPLPFNVGTRQRGYNVVGVRGLVGVQGNF